MPGFCHLHCHTQYSLLDGAARIESLVGKASSLGIPALAITDHGNLFGVPEFYSKCRQHKIQPILGCEFYIAPSGMDDRSDRTRYHQVLLARNETGYRNLIRLSSLSYTRGYYYKPRIDLDTLRDHSEGLIATTCCLQGEIPQNLLKRGEEAARLILQQYLEIFGENYYVELMDHGIAEQRKANAVLERWGAEFGIPIIATNDVHYVDEADHEAQDVLLCLQTGKDLTDPNRMRFENNQFYLKGREEMAAAFVDHDARIVDRALDTTMEIADKCTFELPMGKLLMPHYPLPPAFESDMDGFLNHLVFEGAKRRYDPLTQEITERLNYELGVIRQMGYAGYFLIVQDFTTAARKLNVRVGPGRGSAAGSAVAYCLGITNIDPLKYDLLFERFLNPERVSMPDIDIDFDDRGRSQVIDYVVKKYGRDNVCQIITFGTMGARSVIRDVSRVLGIPLSESDRIAKLIPEGPKSSLERAISEVPEFRRLSKDEDEQKRKLIQFARVLEGSARHTGVHAAGVIIAPGNVSDYVPISTAKGKSNGEEIVVTQYDGKWIEEFGLLKMDFLGLKTLTVLNDTLALVRENHNVEIDIDDIPLDDARTFDLFQRADTVAIFQFESDGMRDWLRKLKPTSIDDLIAMNALYRPGPMDLIPLYVDRKHGREPVNYPHEMLKPILEPTYGIPVYQEQVMQIAQEMAGYSLGGADLLRRAMGKKKQEEMDKQRTVFVEGAARKGISAEKANEVFNMMEKFAGYGFNKSHSAAYSIVAYQTAYLKARYPAEFMAAVMTNEMSDSKKLAVVLDEARRMSLSVLPPNINRSEAHFTVDQNGIRFGLAAIKGVGHGAIECIAEARRKEGPFQSIFDMCKRIDLRGVGKKTLDCLARAGALDEFGGHRAQLVLAVEDACRYGQKIQADRALGQSSLFGALKNGNSEVEPPLPSAEPWSRSELLKNERELIGFYISGHPLETFAPEVRTFATAQFGRPHEIDTERPHAFCGIITGITHRTTRQGRPMAFATIEDFTGQGEVVLFSDQFERNRQYVQIDELIMVKGTVEIRGGAVKVLGDEIIPMRRVRDQMVRGIILRVDSEEVPIEKIDRLKSLCEQNRGTCRLYFDVSMENNSDTIRLLSRHYVVDPTPDLMRGITELFGSENIGITAEA